MNFFSHPYHLALHMLKTAGQGSNEQKGSDPTKEIILPKGYMQSIKHKIQIKRNIAKCKAVFLPQGTPHNSLQKMDYMA